MTTIVTEITGIQYLRITMPQLRVRTTVLEFRIASKNAIVTAPIASSHMSGLASSRRIEALIALVHPFYFPRSSDHLSQQTHLDNGKRQRSRGGSLDARSYSRLQNMQDSSALVNARSAKFYHSL
jgi:hypothetical protein